MKAELEIITDNDNELVASFASAEEEAPFAVVGGEPLTEMPKDLYIPPGALQVFLEAFSGPLDLLLYLIRKQNLDILDIPIADITRQYTQYIELMQELELELAGEYLLMAAMLAEIKSRMLLPRPAVAGEEEEDPRAELVRRLQEYERFKKAAEDLDALPRMERDALAANAELVERKVLRREPDVTLKEMLKAIKAVLKRADMFAHHHIQREPLSVRQRMTDILTTLQGDVFVPFASLFRPEEGRMGVAVTFMAVLELMREALVEIVQAEPYAPLHVRPKSSIGTGAAGASDVADAENEAALAQPKLEGEDEVESDDWSDTPETPVETDAQNEQPSEPQSEVAQEDSEPVDVERIEVEQIQTVHVETSLEIEAEQADAELFVESVEIDQLEVAPLDNLQLDAQQVDAEILEADSSEALQLVADQVDVELIDVAYVEAERLDGAAEDDALDANEPQADVSPAGPVEPEAAANKISDTADADDVADTESVESSTEIR